MKRAAYHSVTQSVWFPLANPQHKSLWPWGLASKLAGCANSNCLNEFKGGLIFFHSLFLVEPKEAYFEAEFLERLLRHGADLFALYNDTKYNVKNSIFWIAHKRNMLDWMPWNLFLTREAKDQFETLDQNAKKVIKEEMNLVQFQHHVLRARSALDHGNSRVEVLLHLGADPSAFTQKLQLFLWKARETLEFGHLPLADIFDSPVFDSPEFDAFEEKSLICTELNKLDSNGLAAIHHVVRGSKEYSAIERNIKSLVRLGANLFELDIQGRSFLWYAAEGNNLDKVPWNLFLTPKAKDQFDTLEEKTKEGIQRDINEFMSDVLRARSAPNHSKSRVEVLLYLGADPSGFTELLRAFLWDARQAFDFGKLPLEEFFDSPVFDALEENGKTAILKELNEFDEHGKAAIHHVFSHAPKERFAARVEALINRGADLFILDASEKKHSAFWHAWNNGNLQNVPLELFAKQEVKEQFQQLDQETKTQIKAELKTLPIDKQTIHDFIRDDFLSRAMALLPPNSVEVLSREGAHAKLKIHFKNGEAAEFRYTDLKKARDEVEKAWDSLKQLESPFPSAIIKPLIFFPTYSEKRRDHTLSWIQSIYNKLKECDNPDEQAAVLKVLIRCLKIPWNDKQELREP